MDDLSESEYELLNYVITGYPEKLIAYRMKLSASTVGTYVGTLYKKLGVKSKHSLILRGCSAVRAELTASEVRTFKALQSNDCVKTIAKNSDLVVGTVFELSTKVYKKLGVKSRWEFLYKYGASTAHDDSPKH